MQQKDRVTIHTGWNLRARTKVQKRRLFIFQGVFRNHRLLDDTEDIEIDDDRFMSFCTKFKYLGTYFVPKLSDKEDIRPN